MRKTLLLDLAKCTGCEMCVDICSGRHAAAYSEKVSRIRIHKDQIEAVFIPLVCEQCREHPCVEICQVNAIKYDEGLHIFKVENETCIGCGACEEACPYSGIFLSEDVALKCDLCGGEPACVQVCYPKALRFVELADEVILADLELKAEKLKKMRSSTYE